MIKGDILKIIHCADIHLGSKINTTMAAISKAIKTDVRNSFMRMCEYARGEDIHIILLSGDVFDSDVPLKKDKDNFYQTIRNYSDIDFLYLKGNHDLNTNYDDIPKNLKCFNDTWTKYAYDNVVIAGLEMTGSNESSLYTSLNLNENNLNIVMLHGMVSDTVGLNNIKLSLLKNKNIDYLALGHVHTYKEYKIDSRGAACYAGCLEGRGFDETGPKGFIVLDITNKINYDFHPFSLRVIHDEEIDISSSKTVNDVINIINQRLKPNDNDIYKLTLKGEVSPELDLTEMDIISYYQNVYFMKVYLDTTIIIDYAKYENDISLKGEFVRTILNDLKLDDKQKKEIISLGLKVLDGREVDLYENN